MNLEERIEQNIQSQKFYDELIEVANRLIELSTASDQEYDMSKALERIEFLKARQGELMSKGAFLQNEWNNSLK